MALVGFVGLCLLTAASAGAVTATTVRTWYPGLRHPIGTPPNWVFGPVWTALYMMIAIAGWLVWKRCRGGAPLRLWGWQLLLNALWPPAFFGLKSPSLALVVIAALIVMLLLTVRAFARLSRPAAWLMVPYLAWTVFAAYLNAGILWLNHA